MVMASIYWMVVVGGIGKPPLAKKRDEDPNKRQLWIAMGGGEQRRKIKALLSGAWHM